MPTDSLVGIEDNTISVSCSCCIPKRRTKNGEYKKNKKDGESEEARNPEEKPDKEKVNDGEKGGNTGDATTVRLP